MYGKINCGGGSKSVIIPSNPTVSGLTGPDSVILNWSDTDEKISPVKYNIYVSEKEPLSQKDMQLLGTVDKTQKSYIVEGMEVNKQYWFVVQCVNESGFVNARIDNILSLYTILSKFLMCTGDLTGITTNDVFNTIENTELNVTDATVSSPYIQLPRPINYHQYGSQVIISEASTGATRSNGGMLKSTDLINWSEFKIPEGDKSINPLCIIYTDNYIIVPPYNITQSKFGKWYIYSVEEDNWKTISDNANFYTVNGFIPQGDYVIVYGKYRTGVSNNFTYQRVHINMKSTYNLGVLRTVLSNETYDALGSAIFSYKGQILIVMTNALVLFEIATKTYHTLRPEGIKSYNNTDYASICSDGNIVLVPSSNVTSNKISNRLSVYDIDVTNYTYTHRYAYHKGDPENIIFDNIRSIQWLKNIGFFMVHCDLNTNQACYLCFSTDGIEWVEYKVSTPSIQNNTLYNFILKTSDF